MTLVKKIKDKKVNFEFNKEFIKVVTDKIANNDALFIINSFKEIFNPYRSQHFKRTHCPVKT